MFAVTLYYHWMLLNLTHLAFKILALQNKLPSVAVNIRGITLSLVHMYTGIGKLNKQTKVVERFGEVT